MGSMRTNRGFLSRWLITAGLLLVACQPSVGTSTPVGVAPTSPMPAVSPTSARTSSTPVATAMRLPSPPSPAAQSASAVPAPSPSAIAGDVFVEAAIADFYRGKTVRIVVGFGAGGGYDTYARLMAKYLPKYIPGGPNVIVENLPGAGGKLSYSQVANAFPKDGTVIGFSDGSLAEAQVLNPSDFDFDFAKIQYIGAPGVLEYVFVMTKQAQDRTGIKHIRDILGPSGKQIVSGTAGGGVEYFTQILLQSVLTANLKPVSGYAGTAAIRLAMDSGELDAYVNSWDSVHTTNDADIRSGNLIVLARLTEQPIATLPPIAATAPGWLELAKTEEDKQILRLGSIQPQLFARGMYFAPGVPTERLAALRSAFTKTMVDPGMVADAAQAKLDINPIPGAELQGIVASYLNMPEAARLRLKQILQR